MPSLPRRLALVALGTTLGLILSEGLVRLADEGHKSSLGVLYRASPTVGWEHRPGVRFEHGSDEYSIVWQLNDSGLRRDEDVDPAEQSGGPRVVVLGDSHTAGHGVDGHETYAARLEATLDGSGGPDWQVLNAGVDGYTTSQQLQWLDDQLERWRPSGVIVGVYPGNDLRENLEPVGLGGYPRPLIDPHRDELLPPRLPDDARDVGVGPLAATKDWLSERSRLYAFLGDRIRGGPLQSWLAAAGLMRPPTPSTTGRVVARVQGGYGQLLWQLQGLAGRPERLGAARARTQVGLARMAAACADAEVHFLVAVLPVRSEVEGVDAALQEAAGWLGIDEPLGALTAAIRRDLVAFLEARGLPHLDLLPPALAQHATDPGTPLFYPRDWHLNAAGHAWVADQLAPAVANWTD